MKGPGSSERKAEREGLADFFYQVGLKNIPFLDAIASLAPPVPCTRNTIPEFWMLYLMKQIHHPNAEDTNNATQNSKYANQNSNINLRCFVAMQFLPQIYALFRRTIYRPKNAVA